jgi:hypothetical protein
MVKRNVQKNNKKQRPQRKTSRKSSKMSNPRNPTFGAVSTISTAPVAIGNSLRGSQPVVLQVVDGVRVIGRDYGFTPVQTGSVATWALVGGMPLTPACMPSTALRNFMQLYNKFKFNACNFHYITSSSTSTTGDVLFQYNKNADSSTPEWTSNSFLPYVLSDPLTVLGPQWTNHTMMIKPSGPFRSTDYGINQDASLYSQGDIFLYSKTSSTESPGYVIFDYDITFKELSVNPRAGLLPLAIAQWTPFDFTAATTTAGAVASLGTGGLVWIGGTNITAFAGSIGSIFKVILDITNSSLGDVATAATLLKYPTASTTITSNLTSSFTLKDGETIYGVVNNTNLIVFYATETAAYAGGSTTTLSWGASNTTALRLNGYAKFIGSVNPAINQVQY